MLRAFVAVSTLKRVVSLILAGNKSRASTFFRSDRRILLIFAVDDSKAFLDQSTSHPEGS
jgi:hypothetical protein